MVIAFLGTFSTPLKSFAASFKVNGSRVTNRVTEFRWEPGSLNPI